MKHLKRFNESYDIVNGIIFFEDKDWSKIEDYKWEIFDYLESANYPIRHKILIHDFGHNSVQMLHITSTKHIILKSPISGSTRIAPPIDVAIAVDSDEWFYVELTSNTNKPLSTTKTNYYRCDQLEGLLELLKDKVIGSKSS